MMKKVCLFLLMVIVLSSSLWATKYHSVSLDSEAYRIIEVGENRGIIPLQTEVKPYNLNTVRKLLREIKASEDISEKEREIIEKVLGEFDATYGSDSERDTSSSDIDILNYTRLGVGISTTQKVGLVKGGDKIFDSRSSLSPYIRGDILGALSYDLNFSINYDKVDANAYLPTELLFSTEGFYMNLFEGGKRMQYLPDDNFYIGIETFPEMSTSIKDDIVSMRIGSVRRDWGPGVNNLALSGSASVMTGFELALKPASWFNYSVMVASLGQASLNSVNGIPWPSENMDNKTGLYSNNLSIHRVEITAFEIKASIWESVVWRKRFELQYLNPLGIYMFSQNALGDYDNCLAGFDVSYTVKNVGTLYAAFAMDEMNSFKHPITCPRNIFALQAGGTFPLPVFSFTTLKLQATYVAPFFGAHYKDDAAVFGGVEYSTPYVNKGKNIGYPVNPDTIELLLSFDTTLFSDWKVGLLVKNQTRSAQYAIRTTGTDVLTVMNYDAYNADEYASRSFFGNIYSNLLSAEFTVEKSFFNKVTFNCGLLGMFKTERSFGFSKDLPKSDTYGVYNPGNLITWTGDWASTLSFVVTLGAKVVF